MEDRTKTEPTAELRNLLTNLNNNYVHWDKFKDMQLVVPESREQIWQLVQEERAQGFSRNLAIGPFQFKWWISNSLEALLHRLDVDMAGGRGLETLLESKHTHRHRTNALLDESITSAQLAGATVSKKAAKEMLLKKRIPQNTDEQVCANIFRALQWILSMKDEVLTEARLLQLHQVLTKDTIKQKGIGQYRTNNKVDLSAIESATAYKPVDAVLVPGLVPQILELYNVDGAPFFIHPLVKACLIHFLIITVRPFRDANGRVARLLAQMYLLKKGYWVAEFMSVSNVIAKLKTQYNKSIAHAESDNNNAGYFIQFYTQSIQMAHKSLRDFVLRITREKTERPAQKRPGYNERQTAVIQWLQEDGEKIVTIRELRSVYGVSKETARTDLTALVTKGWIKYYHINKKTYAFTKGAAFEALVQQPD